MIYLDNGATTYPKPPEVARAVERGIRIFGGNPGRGGHRYSMEAGRIVYRCRERAADFFGCSAPEWVVFTSNATMALNLAIKGVLRPGDHVVTSCFEHNAVARPCHKLQQQGVEWTIAGQGAEEDTLVEAFEKAIRPNTRLVICNHASNVFGNLLPVERIGQLCRERGILFLVDASQSAGVVPIFMEKMNIDLLCTAGHKGLLGPQGTGLLLWSGKGELDTLLEGGTGSDSMELRQPQDWPDRMESGTGNVPGIMGLEAGMAFIQRVGMKNIHQKEQRLRTMVKEGLERMPHVKVLSLSRKNTGVLSFQVEGMDCEEVARRLDQRGIAVRAGLHCAPLAHQTAGTLEQGTVRVSFGPFNTPQQCKKLLWEVGNLKNVARHI